MFSTIKRSQKDYFLAFKLAVVEQVEQGELLTNKRKSVTAFKVAALYWFGFVVG